MKVTVKGLLETIVLPILSSDQSYLHVFATISIHPLLNRPQIQ
jgi:hypothetical protein